ncbi:anti-sigma factor [Roseibium sp. MMSF_3544]|uniref:anti-sigma factor family protein n=1 Tax=unclassified Roseibium TaxID=2629323 RepID=UPI00273E2AD1|nr:zf-HC2 domain-containing protein [Roseibium sp. MMSF_3544]
MTDQTQMTDELIMAYADGELPEAEAKKVERAAETSEEVRDKIRMFKQTARELKGAAADLPPVPDQLADRISTLLAEDTGARDLPADGNVVPFARKAVFRQWPTALAASITLAIGLAVGMSAGPFGTPDTTSPFGIAALADPGIDRALSEVASGGSTSLDSGATLNVIASFVDADSTLCREFDYEAVNGPSIVSVACRVGQTWEPRIAIAASSEQSAVYAPASSLEALEAWLSSSGMGSPLELPEEKQRLDRIGSGT